MELVITYWLTFYLRRAGSAKTPSRNCGRAGLLVQSMRNLEFVLEKRFHLEQLTQVSFTFHQRQMLFNIVENICDTPGVQIAKIQIEWEVPCPALILNHISVLLQTAQFVLYI